MDYMFNIPLDHIYHLTNAILYPQNQKLEQLNEMLYSFEKSCLPSMPKLLTIGQPVYSDDIFKLESSWKDIVKDYQVLKCKITIKIIV